MSKTEDTVAEVPKGAAAFDAARAAVTAQSKDQDVPLPESNDTPPTPPAEDPDKVADQPDEPTDDDQDALLTADELDALPPKERAKAEKWQAKLTRAAQEQSAARKELDEWKTLIDALKSDPDSAITQLAERRGLKLTKAEVEQDTTASEIPKELEFLKPLFDARDKAMEAKFEAKYGPIGQKVDTIISEAAAAESQATETAFAAKYPDYPKLQKRMLELGQEFIPAKPMEDFKYLEHLRTLAMVDISEAEKTKKVVAKINKSVASAETSESGVPSHRVEHHLPPPEKRSIREAFDAAKRGERWVK